MRLRTALYRNWGPLQGPNETIAMDRVTYGDVYYCSGCGNLRLFYFWSISRAFFLVCTDTSPPCCAVAESWWVLEPALRWGPPVRPRGPQAARSGDFSTDLLLAAAFLPRHCHFKTGATSSLWAHPTRVPCDMPCVLLIGALQFDVMTKSRFQAVKYGA